MALTESLQTEIGTEAPNFSLLGVDGKFYSPEVFFQNSVCSIVMFICNHCPYVVSKIGLIVGVANLLKHKYGGETIAVMPNDTISYPDDSYHEMKIFAQKHGFKFPYVIDDRQEVAKLYNVHCTPEFFLLDRNMLIQYHGRICEHGKIVAPEESDLYKAIEIIVEGGEVSNQKPSIGCSVKWFTDSN